MTICKIFRNNNCQRFLSLLFSWQWFYLWFSELNPGMVMPEYKPSQRSRDNADRGQHRTDVDLKTGLPVDPIAQVMLSTKNWIKNKGDNIELKVVLTLVRNPDKCVN